MKHNIDILWVSNTNPKSKALLVLQWETFKIWPETVLDPKKCAQASNNKRFQSHIVADHIPSFSWM